MPKPSSSKRTLEEIAQAEDSNDEDYDDHAPGPSKSRSSRSRHGPGAPARKRIRRGGYRGSDISDDEEIESEEEPWSDEADDEEIETNERGRPVRKTVKKAITYEESDEDEDIDELSRDSSDDEPATTPSRSKSKRSKIVTLKISTPLPPTRTLRRRSGSHGAARPTSSGSHNPSGTRRSRRLSHDEEEPVIALSSSGRHVEVVRPGSREPDQPSRAIKGGKSIKYPSKSTIDEDDEPNSVPKVEEENNDEDEEEDDGEVEIKNSQHEIPEDDNADETGLADPIDVDDPTEGTKEVLDVVVEDVDQLQQSDAEAAGEDDDEGPVHRGRLTRGATKRKADSPLSDEPAHNRRRLRSRGTNKRRGQDESSDFDPEVDQEENEELSASGDSEASPQKGGLAPEDYESSNAGGRRSNRLRSKGASRQPSGSEDDADELAEELAELKKDGKRKRSLREEILFEPRGRRGGRKNYDLLRNIPQIEEDDEPAAPSPSQRARKTGGGGWQRSLFSTYGPFGGAGGLAPVLGGPARPAGDGDSDSSDDEIMKQPKPVGGAVGMTPTTATGAGFNPFAVQPLNNDAAQGAAGTPANLGKIKDKQALADADPLGVDQHVNFDSVGGLEGHIDQLKEMVALPLLYPEIFMRFKITPPRGVLFHGPPGTGKTLLARALATSVSSQGKKVTFYMRKGADALSKWVGEAERQLRLLFEEARKNQPSIIFFDEIDGLAPVRSSKQEQIHASIVSTLLALMDGMDGRGQVIVIGATNRPDSIDPALRRPGRFDREFYFPLPDTEARRSIINIHTRGWNPPLDESVKSELAELTKGYGGADLRALCTEAALNAVQRRYPQIYRSNEKLLIDPKTIQVMPKDFMISIKKMTPSSERSASSGASPLPSAVAPLLEKPLADIEAIIAEIMPPRKKTTPLEEAMYEDVAEGLGFGRERMQQAFESSRVFRPRLLIHGKIGMGQQYVAAAMLNHFQGLHVQSFDLSTILSDTASSPEATVIRLFSEVKMHKPSVIYIPNVQEWYATVGPTLLSTFFGLLRSIKPTDPILVLGILECEADQEDEALRRDLFGYSKRNQYMLHSPGRSERVAFFLPLREYIKTKPSDFPDPEKRKKRQLEVLKPAPPEPEKTATPLSKEELKAQKKRDRQTLNMLKIRLQPIMDQIRTRYKKFRTGVIDESQIRYLYDEADPGTVTSDVPRILEAHASFRPFEVGKDTHGVPGLVDQVTGKFYYNLDSVTIEKRLSNGWYKRPKDFLADIKRLAKDAKTIEDEDRLLKANELLANVEVDITGIEYSEPTLTAECEKVYQRELAREKEAAEKIKSGQMDTNMPPPQITSNIGQVGTSVPSTLTTTDGAGPIFLGEALPSAKDMLGRALPTTPSRPPSHSSNLTNGVHLMHGAPTDAPPGRPSDSNQTDSGHEADVEGDTPMGGDEPHANSNERISNETQKTTSSSFGNRESAQPRPYHSYTAPSQQLRREAGMSEPLSQTGYMTPMAPGSQPADYQNEASTTQTTSDKKHSGPSSSDRQNTQESGPNLFVWEERRSTGGTDVPDTQDNPQLSQVSVNGSSQSQHHNQPDVRGDLALVRHESGQKEVSSQQSAPPVPAFGAAPQPTSLQRRPTNGSLANLLNPSQSGLTSENHQSINLIQPEDLKLDNTLTDIADKTSGLSVEQLEQVNSVLMDTLWRTRGEWNRRHVLDVVVQAFNDVLQDMREAGQDFGPLSWEARKERGIGSTRRIEV